MPYIAPDRRPVIDNYLAALDTEDGISVSPAPVTTPQNAGELNYAFTMLCLRHRKMKFGTLDQKLKRVAFEYLTDATKELRYQRINDVAGALVCAALEMEDRAPTRKFEIATLNHAMRQPYKEIAVTYEKLAVAKNGDIAEFGSPR